MIWTAPKNDPWLDPWISRRAILKGNAMRLRFVLTLGLAGVACGGTVTSAIEPTEESVEICRNDETETVAITNIGSVSGNASSRRVRVVTGNRTTVANPEGNCVFSDTPPTRNLLNPGQATFPKTPKVPRR